MTRYEEEGSNARHPDTLQKPGGGGNLGGNDGQEQVSALIQCLKQLNKENEFKLFQMFPPPDNPT